MPNAILKKNFAKSSAIVASAVGLVFFFQNCGKAGFDSVGTQDSSSLVSTTGTETTISKAAPFMYDAAFDTISYNSCARPGSSGDSVGNYSIKAGSYSGGGLAIIPSAIDYASKNLTPVYPNDAVTYDQSKAFLAAASANKAMHIQAGLRAIDKTNGYPFPTKFTEGREVKYLLGDISTDNFLGPLFNKAQTMGSNGFYTAPTDRFFGYAGYGERKFEVALTLNTSNQSGINAEAEAAWWRNQMVGGGGVPVALALSFKGTSEQYTSVHKDNAGAYRGRLYTMDFHQYQGTQGAESTALFSVSELDMEKQQAAGFWTCDASDLLVIVRQDDAATFCPVENMTDLLPGITDSTIAKNKRVQKLEFFRRHIPSTWRINVGMGCVVPPAAVACYDNTEVINPLDPNFASYYGTANQSQLKTIPRPISYTQNGLHIYQGTLPAQAVNYTNPCQHFTSTSNPKYAQTIVQCAHTISFCRRN